MIKVTLEFANQQELLAFFSAPTAEKAVKVEPPKSAKATAPTPSASKPDPANTTAPAAGPSDPKPAAVATAPETTAAPAASSGVDYATLQKAVFALANKSREAAGEVAKSLGVANFKGFEQASPEERATALAAVTAKLAELEVA